MPDFLGIFWCILNSSWPTRSWDLAHTRGDHFTSTDAEIEFSCPKCCIFMYDQKMHFSLLSKLQLLFYALFDLNDGKCIMVGVGGGNSIQLGLSRLEVAVSLGSFTWCELLIHEFIHQSKGSIRPQITNVAHVNPSMSIKQNVLFSIWPKICQASLKCHISELLGRTKFLNILECSLSRGLQLSYNMFLSLD